MDSLAAAVGVDPAPIYAAWDGVTSFFANIWNSIAPDVNFASMAGDAWGIVKSAWAGAVDYFKGIWAAITPEIGWAASFESTWLRVRSSWADAIGFFANIWSNIKPDAGWAGALESDWQSAKVAWAGASDFFAGIWKSAGDGVATYIEPIGDKLQSIIGSFTSIWDKLGQIGGKMAGLFASSDAENINRMVSALGRIAGFTFDAVLGGLDLLLTGIDKLLGLVTGDTKIDWSAFIPELPQMPDLSAWKQPLLDFVSLSWLPRLAMARIAGLFRFYRQPCRPV